MLKFLQNRPDEQSRSITGISKKPSMTYGISADSPAQFSNRYTTISDSSSINPHYKYQSQRLSKMSHNHKLKAENNNWRLKSNLNLIQQEKILRGTMRDQNYITNYHKNHEAQLQKNGTRYRLVKGQFSGFINQHKNKVFGPLQGPERTLDRANVTKLRLRQESISSLQKLKSNPSLLSTYRPSNRWLQKRKLRKSRELLYNSVRIEQEGRRHTRSPQFQLPKVIKRLIIDSERKSYYQNMHTIDQRSSKKYLQNLQKTKNKNNF